VEGEFLVEGVVEGVAVLAGVCDETGGAPYVLGGVEEGLRMG
jgi:hypothetical protein